MQQTLTQWPDPAAYLARTRPEHPVLCLSPEILQNTARFFQRGFPGLVTYAVKANPGAEVLANLVAAGITAFDVASPAEIAAVRAVCPDAVLHYNNPVRSAGEIVQGIAAGVASWSVDESGELDKLANLAPGTEIAVRFALPVTGAAYDFGSKFGATPQAAADLLAQIKARGFTPALCFHPGTQCDNPAPWVAYVKEAACIAAQAGVPIARLNVGGGFAANRSGAAPDLGAVFEAIGQTARRAFSDVGLPCPDLICEPGRAMVSEAFTLVTQVKALRHGGKTVFLNNGIYGGLTDLRDMGLTGRARVIAPDGQPRTGAPCPRVVFGPTCDSLDRLPDGLALAGDLCPGDYVLFDGMGAYSLAMSTGFNGYGLREVVTVRRMSGH